MTTSLKNISTGILLFLAGFIAASFLAYFMIQRGSDANAQGLTCTVDKSLVEKIYDVVFKRPVDESGLSYVGHNVGFMIDEMAKSQEHKMYTAMFKSMKALEEAERQPGEIADGDKTKFRNMLDEAMSHISTWSKTLPEQSEAKAVIGPEHAQEALNFAYSMIPTQFRSSAEKSFFDPTKVLGAPSTLQIPEQFKLDQASAKAELQAEIQKRIQEETQYRTQIETQYKIRAEQEALFQKQYAQQATTQLTPEQQEALLKQYQQQAATQQQTTTGGTPTY